MKFYRDQNCKVILFSPYCSQFAAILNGVSYSEIDYEYNPDKKL